MLGKRSEDSQLRLFISHCLWWCFKCNECDFKRGNKNGLKAHGTRKHGHYFRCDLCDKKECAERDYHIQACKHSLISQLNTYV